MEINKIYEGNVIDVLKTFPADLIDCVVTSPPYWGLRDYGTGKWEGGDKKCDHKRPDLNPKKRPELPNPPSGWAERDVTVSRAFNNCYCGAIKKDYQLGLEKTPEEFIANMVGVFSEIKRILKKDGTIWVNIGDSYWGGGFGSSNDSTEEFIKKYPKQASNRGVADKETRQKLGSMKKHHEFIKAKDLVGIPWMLAFGLRADGWYLRQDIIWSKPNPMPESVDDRCTKAHEYIFLLSKSKDYFYDSEAIKEKAITVQVSSRPAGWATGKDHTAIGWNTENNRKKFDKRQAGGGQQH